jgi:hypothetical protein
MSYNYLRYEYHRAGERGGNMTDPDLAGISACFRMSLVTAILLLIVAAGTCQGEEEAAITYEKALIQVESYTIAITEEAAVWTRDMYSKWIAWPSRGTDMVLLKTVASLRAAEESARLDRTNGFAHGLLARLYLLPSDTFEEARNQWKTVLLGGGGVSFVAVVYDVDPASHFLFTMRKEGIHVYTVGQFSQGRALEFPPSSGPLFWEAHAGYVPPEIKPVAVIGWDDIEEIRSGNWSQLFTLKKKITLKSDKGKEKSLDHFMVFLAGGIGRFGWELDWYELLQQKVYIRTPTYGPADYNGRLRELLLFFFDPGKRIKAPPISRPRPGW